MELFAAIQARQSIRAYQDKGIEPEKLQTILAAANQAPSAGNLQPYQIYVVRREETKRALAKASLNQDCIAQAPVVLVFCVDPSRTTKYGQRGEELYAVQDSAIAVAYAQLAATALGLATCWIGAFEPAEICRVAVLRAGHRPVALLPIGYAAETPPRTTRRPLEELVIETGR